MSIDVSATEPGKLYLIVTNEPISNWTSNTFTGEVYNVDIAHNNYSFNFVIS